MQANVESSNLIAKKQIVNEIAEKLTVSKSLLLLNYNGFTVSEMEKLRDLVRPLGSEIKIYKNTLLSRAFTNLQYSQLNSVLDGQNAILFSYEDEFASLSKLKKFLKTKEGSKRIRGGMIESKFYDSDTIWLLMDITGKSGLLTMLAWCLQSPIRQLALVLQQVALQKQA